MQKATKWLCLLLITVIVLAALTACGGAANTATAESSAASSSVQTEATTDTSKPDISEEVNLKIYCVGDPSPGDGGKMVIDAANKLLRAKINATIETTYMPWADWTNKYSLVFASGEDFDGIYTANWAYYQQQATKNGFVEITNDMLKKYAPDLLTDLPAEAWDQAKIGDKIYMIPTTFDEFATPHYVVREDLMKKYNVPEIKTLDDFGVYLDAIRKNEKTMVPLDISAMTDYSQFQLIFNAQNEYGAIGNVPLYNFVYKFTDPGATIVNSFETPEFMTFAKKMREWNEAGYWSKNALANKTPSSTSFDNGKSGSTLTNLLAATNYSYSWPKAHSGWEVQAYDSAPDKKITGTPYIGSGLGIHASSQNIERMLMLADYARTDKELNQLFCYGIKDVQYSLSDVDKVTYIRGNTKTDYTDGLSWFFRNSKFQLKPANVYSNYDKIFESEKQRQVIHVLQSFNFDDTALKNEMAALTNVVNQYGVPVITGAMDPEKEIPVLNSKLKEAGLDKVMAAIKDQAQKYMAEHTSN
jgi:putative aldouronate transport system substrate-binding protein